MVTPRLTLFIDNYFFFPLKQATDDPATLRRSIELNALRRQAAAARFRHSVGGDSLVERIKRLTCEYEEEESEAQAEGSYGEQEVFSGF